MADHTRFKILLLVFLIEFSLIIQSHCVSDDHTEEKISHSRDIKTMTKNRAKNATKTKDECRRLGSCKKCSERDDCVWCENLKICKLVPISHMFPFSRECKSSGIWHAVHVGVCIMDFKTIAITVSAAALVLLIIICCCLVKFCRCAADCVYYSLCCCCCCSSNDSKKEDRRLKRIERQLERQAKRQELLLKLGLKTNAAHGTTTGYSQFQDTPI